VGRLTLVFLMAGLCAGPLYGQRVNDNVITEAEDAFGSSVAGENLGVYDADRVRGFSPTKAGNLRLEGLYIDRQSSFSQRLSPGNRIRVGPSVLGYGFSAPTGIVDYHIRKPGAETVVSMVAKADSFEGYSVEVDAQLPIDGARFGVAAGSNWYHNSYSYGGKTDLISNTVVLRWRPTPDIDILPFWSQQILMDQEAEPIILGNGTALPDEIKRMYFIGQRWADSDYDRYNYGVLARATLGGWRLRGGLFRSTEAKSKGHALLYQAAAAGMPAERMVIADSDLKNGSTSGEVRALGSFGTGALRHSIDVSIRGRDQRRRYGGADRLQLGAAPFGEPLFVSRPVFSFGEKTRSRVDQLTFGAAYGAVWRDVGEVNLGVQKSRYRRTVETPLLRLPTSRADPWLYSAAAAIEVTPRLKLYGGAARGLEESDIAPDNAVNRNEAPPAIATRQIDGGVQWRLTTGMTMVAGLFRITKPYYGLDRVNQFRRLGMVEHRGIELSLSGSPLPGLSVVAGAVLLNATLGGDEVDDGTIGRRPIGTPGRVLIANVDYRFPSFPALSFDIGVQEQGRQFADIDNEVRIPRRMTVDIGTRYRFKAGGNMMAVRLQLTNMFDNFGWDSVSSNAFRYNTPRKLAGQLIVDF